MNVFIGVLIILVILVMSIYFYRNEMNYKLRRILPNIKITDRILDLGSGNGCLTTVLTNRGYNVTAIDVVDKSNGKCAKPIIFDGNKIPFEDEYFDVVIVTFVLHHIDNYENMISEIRRVTKRCAIIFEDTPVTKIQRRLVKYHQKSFWGYCNGCPVSKSDWYNVLSKYFNDIVCVYIGPFEFPFARKPIFYPINKTVFILKK